MIRPREDLPLLLSARVPAFAAEQLGASRSILGRFPSPAFPPGRSWRTSCTSPTPPMSWEPRSSPAGSMAARRFRRRRTACCRWRPRRPVLPPDAFPAGRRLILQGSGRRRSPRKGDRPAVQPRHGQALFLHWRIRRRGRAGDRRKGQGRLCCAWRSRRQHRFRGRSGPAGEGRAFLGDEELRQRMFRQRAALHRRLRIRPGRRRAESHLRGRASTARGHAVRANRLI